MAAAADRGQRLGDVHAPSPAAGRDEHTVLHGDEQEEGVAARQVHDPVRDDAHTLDVEVLAQRRDEDDDPGHAEVLAGLAARPPVCAAAAR